jgi:uncharacterized protein (TIGR03084 family)
VVADLAALCDDLLEETRVLESVLEELDDSGWRCSTPAPGWTVHDQVSHLAFFDDAVVSAATAPAAFRDERGPVMADLDAFTATVAERNRAQPPSELLGWFRRSRQGVVAVYSGLDPSMRVPWYGRDMSAASAVTARIMETWAHGQDVADGLGVERSATPALRHVAHLGVRTLPHSFTTRGLAVPDAPIRVELTSPTGEGWAWGPGDAGDVVRGPALDFCLVVTRRRHAADTDLVASGAHARQWLTIAQTFAGPPGAGRHPGQFPRTRPTYGPRGTTEASDGP